MFWTLFRFLSSCIGYLNRLFSYTWVYSFGVSTKKPAPGYVEFKTYKCPVPSELCHRCDEVLFEYELKTKHGMNWKIKNALSDVFVHQVKYSDEKWKRLFRLWVDQQNRSLDSCLHRISICGEPLLATEIIELEKTRIGDDQVQNLWVWWKYNISNNKII